MSVAVTSFSSPQPSSGYGSSEDEQNGFFSKNRCTVPGLSTPTSDASSDVSGSVTPDCCDFSAAAQLPRLFDFLDDDREEGIFAEELGFVDEEWDCLKDPFFDELGLELNLNVDCAHGEKEQVENEAAERNDGVGTECNLLAALLKRPKELLLTSTDRDDTSYRAFSLFPVHSSAATVVNGRQFQPVVRSTSAPSSIQLPSPVSRDNSGSDPVLYRTSSTSGSRNVVSMTTTFDNRDRGQVERDGSIKSISKSSNISANFAGIASPAANEVNGQNFSAGAQPAVSVTHRLQTLTASRGFPVATLCFPLAVAGANDDSRTEISKTSQMLPTASISSRIHSTGVGSNRVLPTGNGSNRILPTGNGNRRAFSELDDHRYSSSPVSGCPPIKLPRLERSSAAAAKSGPARRPSATVLEHFLLTKEPLKPNEGSDAMLVLGDVRSAHVNAGRTVGRRQSAARKSVLEGLLTTDMDSYKKRSRAEEEDDEFQSNDSSCAPNFMSTVSENYELFGDHFLADGSGFDTEAAVGGWIPSQMDERIFSSEVEEILREHVQPDDIWMHQYLSDLL